MSILERILLYAVTATSIALVFRGEGIPSNRNPEADLSPQVSPSSETQETVGDPNSSILPAEIATFPDAAPVARTKAQNNRQPSNALTLKDRRGVTRLEIKLGPDDQPQILLNDPTGREILALKASETGTGQIRLKHFRQELEIGSEGKGGLAVVLKGEQAEEIRFAITADGEAKFLTKGRSPATISLSSQADGAADLQIHRGPGTGGPLLSLAPQGQAAIGIANNDREYGPVMHLFEDGLGQVSINGPGSESGPTLIRTPDGTSVISVRHPNGQPAASMVSSPTGATILAVTNVNGTQQASMRSDKEGKVDIGVTESKENDPPPPAKPPVKPPKIPQIELIQKSPDGPILNVSTAIATAVAERSLVSP